MTCELKIARKGGHNTQFHFMWMIWNQATKNPKVNDKFERWPQAKRVEREKAKSHHGKKHDTWRLTTARKARSTSTCQTVWKTCWRSFWQWMVCLMKNRARNSTRTTVKQSKWLQQKHCLHQREQVQTCNHCHVCQWKTPTSMIGRSSSDNWSTSMVHWAQMTFQKPNGSSHHLLLCMPTSRAKSHAKATMTSGKGAAQSISHKQKLNARSSTEAELVSADDIAVMTLWTRSFPEAQDHTIKKKIPCQDNNSTMPLEENGKKSSGEQICALSTPCFFMTNQVEKGNVMIEHCPTNEMTGDHMTKPLQVFQWCCGLRPIEVSNRQSTALSTGTTWVRAGIKHGANTNRGLCKCTRKICVPTWQKDPRGQNFDQRHQNNFFSFKCQHHKWLMLLHGQQQRRRKWVKLDQECHQQHWWQVTQMTGKVKRFGRKMQFILGMDNGTAAQNEIDHFWDRSTRRCATSGVCARNAGKQDLSERDATNATIPGRDVPWWWLEHTNMDMVKDAS